MGIFSQNRWNRTESNKIDQFGFGSSTKWVDIGTMHQDLIGSSLILSTVLRANSEFGSSEFFLLLEHRCTRSLNIRPQNYLM